MPSQVEPWIREYLLLVLRVDRCYRASHQESLIDCYYGPAELKAALVEEPIREVAELRDRARALAESVPNQGMEQERGDFLRVHLVSLETYCRSLAGEHLSLEDEIVGCLDVRPEWRSEAPCERSLALLEGALPGPGDLRSRFLDFQRRTSIAPGQADQVADVMRRMLAEARRRSERFVQFPPSEGVELATVREVDYGAANRYLGGYRSRLELNVDRPINLLGLVYQMCHEGYPGHHMEFTAKEQHLLQRRGYRETSVFFFGPQLVIAEGVASLAQRMIFDPPELADWLQREIFTGLDVELGEVDLPGVIEALDLIRPDDLQANLVIMLREGRQEQELVDYALAYTAHAEGQIRSFIGRLRSPLAQVYAFSYSHGKELMEPLLEDEQRGAVFSRLLSEQLTPSSLRKWAGA